MPITNTAASAALRLLGVNPDHFVQPMQLFGVKKAQQLGHEQFIADLEQPAQYADPAKWAQLGDQCLMSTCTVRNSPRLVLWGLFVLDGDTKAAVFGERDRGGALRVCSVSVHESMSPDMMQSELMLQGAMAREQIGEARAS